MPEKYEKLERTSNALIIYLFITNLIIFALGSNRRNYLATTRPEFYGVWTKQRLILISDQRNRQTDRQTDRQTVSKLLQRQKFEAVKIKALKRNIKSAYKLRA